MITGRVGDKMRFLGLTLMTLGIVLLVTCKLAGWQTNAELIVGLILVISGFIVHIMMMKKGEKY